MTLTYLFKCNEENKNSHILTAALWFSTLIAKQHVISPEDLINAFVLTLKHLLTTNRTMNTGGISPESDILWQAHRFTVWSCALTSQQTVAPSIAPGLQPENLSSVGQIEFQDRLLSWDWTKPGNPTSFRGRSQVLIYKMAIFFFHNSMLLHYQILSRGQYLIPEVLDVNERCFASGHWGLNQQA